MIRKLLLLSAILTLSVASTTAQIATTEERYNDDAAIAALAAAINSKEDMIRGAAASALCVNQHPKAESLLVKMWNDPIRSVRINVAMRLRESRSPESLVLLNKMLKDADEYVREAARKSLEARTSPS